MSRAARRAALLRGIERVERRLAPVRQRSERLGWLRVILFIGTLAGGVAMRPALGGGAALLTWLVGLLLFGGLVAWHRRVQAGQRRLEGWKALAQEQLARQAIAWEAIPGPTQPAAAAVHPFARDLDLAGERSLHQLLDLATTSQGSACLLAWLSEATPEPEPLRERQRRVAELRPLAALRHRLLLAGMPTRGRQEPLPALDWLYEYEEVGPLVRRTALLTTLAAITIPLFVAAMAGWLSEWWLVPFALYVALFFFWARALGTPFDQALDLRDATVRLARVAVVLERERLADAPSLRAWLAPFHDGAARPSAYLRRLSRLTAFISMRQHPFMWLLLNSAVPWDYYSALGMALFRRSIAARLPGWVDRWTELEALASLAAFGWLQPEYAMPEFHDDAATSPLRAEALGHPLIPHEERVANDFAWGALGEVGLITGSNMSGKSSFLRTVGVAVALAQAGGPVAARSLALRPMRLFSAIQISDSLADHISHFYAEVRRLRALLDALEGEAPLPLCFLIDEIFAGTNNRERLIGSRSYLRAIVGRRGVGLVSTHDLELVTLAERLPALRLYHFRESIVGERMSFDYFLRPGPSPTTNALVVMRLAGLPVEEEGDGGDVGDAGDAGENG